MTAHVALTSRTSSAAGHNERILVPSFAAVCTPLGRNHWDFERFLAFEAALNLKVNIDLRQSMASTDLFGDPRSSSELSGANAYNFAIGEMASD